MTKLGKIANIPTQSELNMMTKMLAPAPASAPVIAYSENRTIYRHFATEIKEEKIDGTHHIILVLSARTCTIVNK